jgi:hypothetical protein
MPASVIDPRSSAVPYVLLLFVCLLVFLVCIINFRSLRVYRRKRNLLVYAVFALVLTLIAYHANEVSLGPSYISYGIKKTQTPIYAMEKNQFGVTCYCDGGKEATFYMVMKCANATLQIDEQANYIKVNDTAVKIPFSFRGSGEQTKPVYFMVNANVSSVEFYPSIERELGSSIMVTTWLSEIRCVLDPATGRYAMADSLPIPVP